MILESRHRSRDEVSINLTPLIDVVVTLIIFFMVATRFNRDTQIAVNLPEANGSEMSAEQTVVEISVDEGGVIYVNGKALVNNELETVKRAVQEVANGDNALPMIISADGKAPYQSVVTAMDAAGQLGFSRLTMAAQSPQKE